MRPELLEFLEQVWGEWGPQQALQGVQGDRVMGSGTAMGIMGRVAQMFMRFPGLMFSDKKEVIE
jgi:hypothetical protein